MLIPPLHTAPMHALGATQGAHPEASAPTRPALRYRERLCGALWSAALALWVGVGACGLGAAQAQSIDLAAAPLLTLKTAPGLVMLTLGRDHTMYYAAYNDVTDLDGDGSLDLYFKPTVRYEGYFAGDRCYDYGGNRFTPVAYGTAVRLDPDDRSKDYFTCSGNYSGNWLNWATMTRMDVLRKVLYGGSRSTDTAGATVLERAYVPADSHIWGKEYQSIARDGYDIRLFTPYSLPVSGTRHLFANLTQRPDDPYELNLNPPLLLEKFNDTRRAGEWVVRNRSIGDYLLGDNVTQRTVRVVTCVAIGGRYEDNCVGYPRSGTATSFKPTGLLHRYGEEGRLAFGLLTGSYDRNYSGGVVRSNIGSFADEVNATTGRFKTNVSGVVQNLNRIRAWGFGSTPHEGNDVWDCGWTLNRQRREGECAMWGNPLGEMMYEGLRYFAGASGPTPQYANGVGVDRRLTPEYPDYVLVSPEKSSTLKLAPVASWTNPYRSYPACSKPLQMVIGDPKTSFDSDQLPGANPAWGSFGGSLNGLNVSSESDAIWSAENLGSRRVFIGEAGGVADGTPSAKLASGFSTLRGHGPDATTNQGSFYGAGVARFGKRVGVSNPEAGATLKVDQVSVAFDSPVPRIEVPVGGRVITVVPLAKAIRNDNGLSPNKGAWQPTGQITGFYIERLANTTPQNADASVNGGRPFYEFRVSFTDADQGSDNETDAGILYRVQLTAGGQVTVGLARVVSGVCCQIIQHFGYVISGTTADGVYLDITGRSDDSPRDEGYFLDTAPGEAPGSAERLGTAPFANLPARLPEETTLASPRSFTPGTSSGGGYIPQDMLWYAAKHGSASYAANGTATYRLKPNGDPENYFRASNPSRLADAVGRAFQQAAALAAATSAAVSANGVRVAGGSLVFQASFDSVRWSGDVSAYAVGTDGNIANAPTWRMSTQLPSPSVRTLVLGAGGTSMALVNPGSYSSLSATQRTTFRDAATWRWLLGERSGEQQNNGVLRDRNSPIGDIVNSDPVYVGAADFGYADADYAAFRTNSNPQVVGAGSNGGMYHLINATNGVEKLAFIPLGAQARMAALADPGYVHDFTVDGPAAFGHVKLGSAWKAVIAGSLGAGGKGVFALDAGATGTAAVLWELNVHPDLGQVLARPIVGRLIDGTGVVIVGNGLNSTNNRAALLVIDAANGTVLRSCQPTDAANVAANGLIAPTAVSNANSGRISSIYAADYRGNVWRFNPNVSDCGGNGGVRLFSAKNAANQSQPITGEIALTAAPNNLPGNMLLFGTGSYITAADPLDNTVQSLYGLYDNGSSTAAVSRSELLAHRIVSTTGTGSSNTRTTTSTAQVNGGVPWYGTANLRGWVIDLSCAGCAAGERTVAKPAVLTQNGANRVFYLSVVPGTDPCAVGGYGFLNGIDPATGSYLKAFRTQDANSLRIDGVSPRGVLVLDNSANSLQLTSVVVVSVTFQGATPPNPIGALNVGGVRLSPDGTAGTATVTYDTGVPTAARTVRQVWRQLQ